eukprot:gb/GEZN01011686.1/.p2 GENE.gb/GEZN01011686.1/~~gb/GEZN01011686.1/.p2  ORF type:complete len:143 (-),score=29.38 gb/GEZN01011686.1/:355-783(-)
MLLSDISKLNPGRGSLELLLLLELLELLELLKLLELLLELNGNPLELLELLLELNEYRSYSGAAKASEPDGKLVLRLAAMASPRMMARLLLYPVRDSAASQESSSACSSSSSSGSSSSSSHDCCRWLPPNGCNSSASRRWSG